MLENRFKENAANCLLLSDQVTNPIIRAGLLGRVDGFDQDEAQSESDDGRVISSGLLAS